MTQHWNILGLKETHEEEPNFSVALSAFATKREG